MLFYPTLTMFGNFKNKIHIKVYVWKSYLVVQVLLVAQVTHLFLEDPVSHELGKLTWQLAT